MCQVSAVLIRGFFFQMYTRNTFASFYYNEEAVSQYYAHSECVMGHGSPAADSLTTWGHFRAPCTPCWACVRDRYSSLDEPYPCALQMSRVQRLGLYGNIRESLRKFCVQTCFSVCQSTDTSKESAFVISGDVAVCNVSDDARTWDMNWHTYPIWIFRSDSRSKKSVGTLNVTQVRHMFNRVGQTCARYLFRSYGVHTQFEMTQITSPINGDQAYVLESVMYGPVLIFFDALGLCARPSPLSTANRIVASRPMIDTHIDYVKKTFTEKLYRFHGHLFAMELVLGSTQQACTHTKDLSQALYCERLCMLNEDFNSRLHRASTLFNESLRERQQDWETRVSCLKADHEKANDVCNYLQQDLVAHKQKLTQALDKVKQLNKKYQTLHKEYSRVALQSRKLQQKSKKWHEDQMLTSEHTQKLETQCKEYKTRLQEHQDVARQKIDSLKTALLHAREDLKCTSHSHNEHRLRMLCEQTSLREELKKVKSRCVSLEVILRGVRKYTHRMLRMDALVLFLSLLLKSRGDGEYTLPPYFHSRSCTNEKTKSFCERRQARWSQVLKRVPEHYSKVFQRAGEMCFAVPHTQCLHSCATRVDTLLQNGVDTLVRAQVDCTNMKHLADMVRGGRKNFDTALKAETSVEGIRMKDGFSSDPVYGHVLRVSHLEIELNMQHTDFPRIGMSTQKDVVKNGDFKVCLEEFVRLVFQSSETDRGKTLGMAYMHSVLRPVAMHASVLSTCLQLSLDSLRERLNMWKLLDSAFANEESCITKEPVAGKEEDNRCCSLLPISFFHHLIPEEKAALDSIGQMQYLCQVAMQSSVGVKGLLREVEIA